MSNSDTQFGQIDWHQRKTRRKGPLIQTDRAGTEKNSEFEKTDVEDGRQSGVLKN